MKTDTANLRDQPGGRLPSEVLRLRIKGAFDDWFEYAQKVDAKLLSGVVPESAEFDEDLRRMKRFLNLQELARKLDAVKKPEPWSKPLDLKLTF